MSRDKLIIFGAVLLGLLGVLVYKQAKRDESLGHVEASTDVPPLAVSGDIDKITSRTATSRRFFSNRSPIPKGAPPPTLRSLAPRVRFQHEQSWKRVSRTFVIPIWKAPSAYCSAH